MLDLYNLLCAWLTCFAFWYNDQAGSKDICRHDIHHNDALCISACLRDLFFCTVTQLQPKHWVKRPLHNNIIEYAVAGVDPLWQLGSRMMKSSGDVGVLSAVRLSKQSIQWHYDGKDKVHLAPSKRWVTVWSVKALACKPSVDTFAAIGLRTLQPEHLHLPLCHTMPAYTVLLQVYHNSPVFA